MNVMIDIETMGTGHDAAIIAIGATKFELTDVRTITDNFYMRVDLRSSVACGMKMTAATVMWWMDKDRADARAALFGSEAIGLPEALDGFKQWFGGQSLPTWGNGATFDNVIMRHAYKLTGIDCPWTYRDDRCYRTFVNLCSKQEIEPVVGVPHHALNDAIYQTYMMQAVAQHEMLS